MNSASMPLALCVACLLASCGGAGTEAAPDLAPSLGGVVEFQDDFDAPEPDAQWTVQGGRSADESAPSTLGLGDAEATPTDHVFFRDGGRLEFSVVLAWPGDCPGEEPVRSRPIQVVERGSGLVVASLVVTPRPGCDEVGLEYRVDPTGTPTSSSVVGLETWPVEDLGDAFHEYVLILREDGLAQWVRDGLVLITSFVPLSDVDLVLTLGGRSGSGEPVLYDAVEVRRR